MALSYPSDRPDDESWCVACAGRTVPTETLVETPLRYQQGDGEVIEFILRYHARCAQMLAMGLLNDAALAQFASLAFPAAVQERVLAEVNGRALLADLTRPLEHFQIGYPSGVWRSCFGQWVQEQPDDGPVQVGILFLVPAVAPLEEEDPRQRVGAGTIFLIDPVSVVFVGAEMRWNPRKVPTGWLSYRTVDALMSRPSWPPSDLTPPPLASL